MDTLNDYLNAPTAEQDAERSRRGWAPRPPAAHTHRGKPVDFALQGHHEATKPARTPTHRKSGPAVIPARFAHLAIAQETTYA